MPRQPVFALVSTVGQDASAGALVHSRSLLAQYAFRVSNKKSRGASSSRLRARPACRRRQPPRGDRHLPAGHQLQQQQRPPALGVRHRLPPGAGQHHHRDHDGRDDGLERALHHAAGSQRDGPHGVAAGVHPRLTLCDAAVELRERSALPRAERQQQGLRQELPVRRSDELVRGRHRQGRWQLDLRRGQRVLGLVQPEPQVGAGAASFQTSQLVNYKEFGRCADVTNMTTSFRYMILYPCKQDPSGGSKLAWNHRWYYGAETGVAAEPDGASGLSRGSGCASRTTRTGRRASPRRHRDPNPPTSTFRSCDSTPSQAFTRYYATGSYTSSYTSWRATAAACRSGRSSRPATTASTGSTMVLETCDGGPAQKWNAPPTALEPSVSRQLETSVSG